MQHAGGRTQFAPTCESVSTTLHASLTHRHCLWVWEPPVGFANFPLKGEQLPHKEK